MASSSTTITKDLRKLKLSKNKYINVVLIGESGVGKSTFINSFANYVQYSDFDIAKNEELLVLIPVAFTVTDRDYNSHKIEIGSDVNEVLDVGMPGTQKVMTYVFPTGLDGILLRVIDTPGMGDCRGIDQDDMNSENILTYIGQLQELHAICFLLQPYHSRLTPYFEYCIKQIFSRLDKSAVDNLIFIFTNTRGADYTPGETMVCLERLIEEIKIRPPYVDIPFRYGGCAQRNVFCFDNEAFRYLAALQSGVDIADAAISSCITSWEHSSKEAERLITYIVEDDLISQGPLKPHQIQNTQSINEARRLIYKLSRPLTDITENIQDNIRIIGRHQMNLRNNSLRLDEMSKKLYMPVNTLKVIPVDKPITVCTSEKCATLTNVNGIPKYHYKQRCHEPCYLTSVQNEIIGDPGLLRCFAMNNTPNCRLCGCHFSIHMHVYYLTETVEGTIENQYVRKNICDTEEGMKETTKFLDEVVKRKHELQHEFDIILKTAAQFAHFLENNAITPFNDSYKKYIEYLIMREQGLGRDANQETIRNLEKLKSQYEEMKRMFDKSLETSTTLGDDAVYEVTSESINDSVETLFNLKHNGEIIRELCETQTFARNEEYKQSEYIFKRNNVRQKRFSTPKPPSSSGEYFLPQSESRHTSFKLFGVRPPKWIKQLFNILPFTREF